MTPDEAKSQATRLLELISGQFATSIYNTHPNTLGALLIDEKSFPIPPEWSGWWAWSGEREDSWSALVKMSHSVGSLGRCDPDIGDQVDSQSDIYGLPEGLSRILLDAKTLSLPRQTDPEFSSRGDSLSISRTGMSPKKFHEVSRMTSYVLNLLETLREQYDSEVRHVVDIGAGQGYLSRALCVEGDARNLHVLALDSSQNQAEGSYRKSQNPKSNGTFTHRVIWLGEEPSFESHPGFQGSEVENSKGLEKVIDSWMNGLNEEDEIRICGSERKPAPVVFVALHSCGSLTPSILQEVLSHRQSAASANRKWFVAAAVVVGCCYNLMRKEDFPLSHTLRRHLQKDYPGFELSSNHLQLAAQVPSIWFRSTDADSAIELAMKKILYRALISPLLNRSDETGASQKLGKLNSKAYESFEGFLDMTGRKMEIDLLSSFKEIIAQAPAAAEIDKLSRRVRTLHALRCLLGPPVESLIILDRYLWLQEELGSSGGRRIIDIVNLFDQETGSGRNVALVLTPSA
ncbi:hypothetical protein A7U60_g6158 [Sanghuangporus baumii]|uniref:Methyltransferase domain-containing protein n=1 Tax=Sanghuangporus baumii TaxID=108892 RepID=A0A9Q5N298_SANBA|nr:hypothetical protein A7U60_g6158 [Sanghuangporus baumii]